jgi:hypothetical protein
MLARACVFGRSDLVFFRGFVYGAISNERLLLFGIRRLFPAELEIINRPVVHTSSFNLFAASQT